VRARPHPELKRDGKNLVYRLKLGLAQAALGTRVEIPSLDGPVPLEVPPGTGPGEVFELEGAGLPDPAGGPPGSLLVVTELEVPKARLSRSSSPPASIAERRRRAIVSQDAASE